MENLDHYRKLERLYRGAPCNEYYSPEIRISEGTAEVSIRILRKMHHGFGGVHGSVFFKLLDDAAFFAVSSLVRDVHVLTAAFEVRLIKSVSEGVLCAQGKITKSSRRLFIAQSVLMNDANELVARGSGSFVKSRIALNEEAGYRY